MPNWCYTQVEINGDSKEIACLDEHFNKAREHEGTKSDFGDMWLGNIVEYLGQDYNSVPCRGSIINYTYDNDSIMLSTETAWAPMMQPILMLTNKYAPNAKITYMAEEPGCEIFLTNDEYYLHKFRVDFFDGELEDPGPEPFTRDELKEWLEEILKTKDGLSNLVRTAKDTYDLYVNEYEYCDVEDL